MTLFGWRRRSEGFEWREYVRTTVLVRRADRQRRIEDARAAAVDKVKHAADAGAEAGRAGVSFAGSHISRFFAFLGNVLLDLAVAIFYVSGRWFKFIGSVIADAFGAVFAPLTRFLRAKGEAAASKLKGVGLKTPQWSARMPAMPSMPDFARRIPFNPQYVVLGLAALGLIYFGGPILRSADGLNLADMSSGVSTGSVTVATEISGSSFAVNGEVLRVDGALVRLEGIEAPETGQPCYRANGKKWDCARAARMGLSRLVRRKAVTCTPSGHDADGRVLARCTIGGDTDVATEAVRHGYVFAVGSFFNSLSAEEKEARVAKAGIWQGNVQRPQEWRDQAWEDAKQAAPDGCPIKGFVRSSTKIYALPWAPEYNRARVRTDRGERWFCSEDEAKAAGFTSSSRS